MRRLSTTLGPAIFGGICWLASLAAAIDNPASALIDTEMQAALSEKNLPPPPRAEDSEFLRRIYLDVLGRIPTSAEAAQYLSDSSADKHHRLINKLLAHEEMPAYWRTVFDEWFNGAVGERDFGRDGFLANLEDAIKSSKPWNLIAREMRAPELNHEKQRLSAYLLAIRVREG
jgi:hypothetical protein